MSDCGHGWNLPPGVPCPECCWERAGSEFGCRGKGGDYRMALVREAVEAAVAAVAVGVPPVEGERNRAYIRHLDACENAWKAIKEAREMNQQGESK